MPLVDFYDSRLRAFITSIVGYVCGIILIRFSKLYSTYLKDTVGEIRLGTIDEILKEVQLLLVLLTLYLLFWWFWLLTETAINQLRAFPFWWIARSLWRYVTVLMFSLFVRQVGVVDKDTGKNTNDIFAISAFFSFALMSFSIEQMVFPGQFIDWQSYFRDTALGLAVCIDSNSNSAVIWGASGLYLVQTLLCEFRQAYRLLRTQDPNSLEAAQVVQDQTSNPNSGMDLVNVGVQTNEVEGILNQATQKLNNLWSLCLILDLALIQISVGPSSRASDILNVLIELTRQAVPEIHFLDTKLIDLWTFLGTPMEERVQFILTISKPEVTGRGILSLKTFDLAREEVRKLTLMKLNKRISYLAELRGRTDINLEQHESIVAIDPLYSLEQIELQILEVEELIAKEEQQISGGIEVNQ